MLLNIDKFLLGLVDALIPRGGILVVSIHTYDARHVIAGVDQRCVWAVEAGGI
jgi:hypothetical protein